MKIQENLNLLLTRLKICLITLLMLMKKIKRKILNNQLKKFKTT